MSNLRLLTYGLLTCLVGILSSCILPTEPLTENWNDRSSYQWAQGDGEQQNTPKPAAVTVPFRPTAASPRKLVVLGPCPPLLFNASMNSGSRIRVRTTAYTHTESDHLAYGRKNAVGTDLKFGEVRSAAADWSRYPVGTEFRIVGQPNVLYVVDDYGSALVGTGTIDLYKPSRAMMNNWGVRHVDIQVVKWGSYDRSRQLMSDRTNWHHVRRMIEGINARLRIASILEDNHPVTASL